MDPLSQFVSCMRFVVPRHQRGYSWNEDNFTDLTKDMDLAKLLDVNHYVGPIVVERTDAPPIRTDPPRENILSYDLQDGQQRLTTFMFACYHVHSRLNASANGLHSDMARDCQKCYSYRVNNVRYLRLENTQRMFDLKLKELMLGGGAPAQITKPGERMDAMFAFIGNYIAGLSDDDMYEFGQYLINQFLFMEVDLSTADVDKNLTFDTINTRGRPLSQFDKIKNFCVLLCSIRANLIHIDPDIHWFNAIKKLEEYDVSDKEDLFANDFYMIYHSTVNVPSEKTHRKLVERYRTLLDVATPDVDLENELIGFIEGWEDYVNSFGFITTGNRAPFIAPAAGAPECNADAAENLTKIDRIKFEAIMRMVHTCTHLRYGQAGFARTTEYTEKYLFRMHGIMGHRTSQHDPDLRKIASKIYEDGAGVKDVNWLLGTLCWLLNRPNEKNATLVGIAKKLGNGDCKYRSAGGWKRGYYFLYEYERSFAGSTHAWTYTDGEQDQQIEHIMPQSRPLYWAAAWPNEYLWGESVHRLGNLVLTENHASNMVLLVKEIALKIEDVGAAYDYDHGLLGERKITDFADDGAGGKVWLKANILERERSLIKFGLERWRLPCCDDEGDVPLPEEFDIGEGDDAETDHVNIPAIPQCKNQVDPDPPDDEE